MTFFQQDLKEVAGVFLGYRKLFVLLSLMTIAVVFRITNLIDGGQTVDLLKNTALGYFAGNATEHFSSVITNGMQSVFGKKEDVTTISETETSPDDPDSQTN